MIKENLLHIFNYYQQLGITDAINDSASKLENSNKFFKSESKKITPNNEVKNFNHDKFFASSEEISSLKAESAAKKIIEPINDFKTLEKEIKNFNGCSLKKNARNTVVGEGVEKPKAIIIGEAPGADEDKQGKPFVGVSGQLLDKMLNSIDLDRTKNIFITNTIYWRPPGNRTPTTEEINICKPFVDKIIELLNPEILILLGGPATSSMLNIKEGITKIRGKWYEYKNTKNNIIPTIATFHPSYLLRSPAQKKKAWQDMLLIKEKLAS